MTPERSWIVIGGGPAGLATAACLARRGVPARVVERDAAIGDGWRRHYDRLHLHTNRRLSNLPGLDLPSALGRYPSRDGFVRYLGDYARHHDLDVRLGETVLRAAPTASGWRVETDREIHDATAVVVATGWNQTPVRPTWPGLESFSGDVLHSSEYRNGARFRGRRVLVVGFGNSGGEIAVDLHEHGARPTLAVRSPVSIVPRQLGPIPVTEVSRVLSKLPTALAHALTLPVVKLKSRGLAPLGLRPHPLPPLVRLIRDRRVPLIDVGTVGLVRRGEIAVRPGIDRFDGAETVFVDGRREAFDALVLATGYRPGFSSFLEGADAALDDQGVPAVSGAPSAVPGLAFCGFHVSPVGMLWQVGREADRIARAAESG